MGEPTGPATNHNGLSPSASILFNPTVQAAYHDYKQALTTILDVLQEPKAENSREQLYELFSLAQNCLHRIQGISENWLLGTSSSDNESDYLRFASEPSSQLVGNRRRVTMDVGHVRTSSVASDKSQAFRPATPTNSRADHSRPSSMTSDNVDLNLSALRKAHEFKLVAEQKEKTRRILRTRAGALAKNEEYVSNLLKRRQSLLVSFNDKISEVYSSISAKAVVIKNSIDMEIRRKSIRNTVAELNQKGQDLAIIGPIVDMLCSPTDPLATLVRDFIQRCRQQLSLTTHHADPGSIVDRVLDEINIIEHHLLDLITQDFDELNELSMQASIKISIQSCFFSTALSPALLLQIRRSLFVKDCELNEKFINCSWQDLFESLKVRKKLQLPRDKLLDTFPIRDQSIYGRAIDDLRDINAHVTPYDKLLCLTRCCNSICQAVDEFKRDSISSQGERVVVEDSSLGSEDLLLLCAYVIVRAHIPDLQSQLTFISKLVPEELIRGEAGYVLATIQTSLEYAISQL